MGEMKRAKAYEEERRVKDRFASTLRRLYAYSGEKGKNLATKDDIAELTRITKQVEINIFDKSWDRQKQWEKTKEVFFEMSRLLARADMAFGKAGATFSHFQKEPVKTGKQPLKGIS
jgi:hypothetical protein